MRTGRHLSRRRAAAGHPLQSASAAGYRDPGADHLRRLAQALQARNPDPVAIRDLAEGGVEPPGPARANALRVALELAVRRLPTSTARELLLGWAAREEVAAHSELARAVGRQLLRLALLGRGGDGPALAEAERLLPGEPLVALARSVLDRVPPPPATEADPPALRLWRAAQALSGREVDLGEAWRQEVRGLRGTGRLRGLAQALLLMESARRGDAAGVAALLDEVDAWRALDAVRSTPPHFVLRAVEAVVSAHPGHGA